MFIGQGFDLNGDGANDLFVGRHVELTPQQKRANQNVLMIILGIFLGLVALYGIVAFGALLILVPLQLISDKKTELYGYIWFAALIGVTLWPLFRLVARGSCQIARSGARKITRSRTASAIRYLTTCLIHGDDAGVDVFYCRRGAKVVGPLSRQQVLTSLAKKQLRNDDLIAADSPQGPWELIAAGIKTYRLFP